MQKSAAHTKRLWTYCTCSLSYTPLRSYRQSRMGKIKLFTHNNGKGKGHPRTGHEGPEREYRYSFTLPLTSALDGRGFQRHAPAALPAGKSRYPLYRMLCGPHGQSGRVRTISPPPGFGPLTVQPVASRYNYLAIPVHMYV
jgi:hypothetical protein